MVAQFNSSNLDLMNDSGAVTFRVFSYVCILIYVLINVPDVMYKLIKESKLSNKLNSHMVKHLFESDEP